MQTVCLANYCFPSVLLLKLECFLTCTLIFFLLSSGPFIEVTFPKDHSDVVDSMVPFDITWKTNVIDDRKTKILLMGGPLTEPQWISGGFEYTLSDQQARVAPLGKVVPPANNYTLQFTLKPFTKSFGHSCYFSVNNGVKEKRSPSPTNDVKKEKRSASPTPSNSPSSAPSELADSGGLTASSPAFIMTVAPCVGVGVPLLAAITGVLVHCYMRRHKAPSLPSTEKLDADSAAEEGLQPGVPTAQYSRDPPPPEGGFLVSDKKAPSKPSELGGSIPVVQELSATTTRLELEGSRPVAQELPATTY